MNDVMLDLETMGNGPNAAIVAIGAVEFDIPSQQVGKTFYKVINLASAMKVGGVVDADTVMWWMGQGDEARSALSKDTVPIAMALNEFYEWVAVCSSIQTVRVWGNGASFDNVILSSAYRSCRIAQPWQFWNDRCYRTVKAMHPAIKMQRTGIHHNAVDDAVSQTRHLLEMLKP